MPKKNSIIALVVILSCITFIFSGCNNTNQKTSGSTNGSKVKVVVSFNAMREFASAIGKDKIDITTIIPNGTEPHDFEPTAKDIKTLGTSDIFVYSGLGMESWKDKVINSAGNKNLIAVDASQGVTPIKNTDNDEIKEHGQYDPHIWLSLKGAEIQSKNIRNALIKADPSNKVYYEKNYNDFSKQLNSLYNEYTKKFASVKNKNFVTGHAAFAYLCRDYGLKQNSVEGIFAEGEPSPKILEQLVNYCKQNKIKTIFVEDMVSPKVSNTLAKEVGAKVEKIYTLESKQDNKNYIQSMRANLEMIYNSLK
ncbi:zinc ABC transporter solute-binding protein [Clostridium tyrobutyricum]|jgi:zinc transport system substrate-binding protein|uniref:Zinc ABC transporter, periplasmic-binding protein ZnuA n=1 Tax=Clostridium tyrobutyricum DIVETGP TaxID=1408889 RepID=W6N3X2_CLOTY|nr:metal ABC transporter substrate-binding protein [Clostridium tyrobutyricum]AND84937.1 zinc transport system substrate-binding protein [Clostridium tyrobutyricum]ANP69507.1 ABC transporter substrate-binding protein [Clostridium tyrobutyricum]MBR9649158.1 zinc ABC transporter substrate-binding protein [Clostridium tyrobutyricum]MBV4416567.1 metal ABC transporter substrate-binding protein [Clostridium tyrobutyricum]MBV4422431.1 metal ABC transporter substrate-binding protein [Clostridium tyrob